jgi:Tol biopolymer transport system component
VSPDGTSIAFTRESETDGGIYIVPALGGPARRVLSLSLNEWDDCLPHPRWSPRGQDLLFAVELPVFSPDGGSVAFVRAKSIFTGDVHVVPIGGGAVTQLTYDDAAIGGLTWTPDGRFIVFSSNRGGTSALWRLPATGGTPEPLAVGGEFAREPAIDRTGHRLAYVRSQGDTQLYALDLRRPADPLRVIAPSSRDENGPSFSPDGRRIAFASVRAGSREDIWIAHADGSHPLRLTLFPAGQPMAAGSTSRQLAPGRFRCGKHTPMAAQPFRSRKPEACCWVLAGDGIYFLDVENRLRPSVIFYSFLTRRRTAVATLPRPVAAFESSLAISSDYQHLLVVLQEPGNADIHGSRDLPMIIRAVAI